MEHELVEKLYEGQEAKAFPMVIDYYIPTGVITYCDLYAYKFEAASRTVFKFLDIRPRLQEEASYFTSKPLPSLRLFILLLATIGIRLLTALNLLKLREVHEVWRGSMNKEAV